MVFFFDNTVLQSELPVTVETKIPEILSTRAEIIPNSQFSRGGKFHSAGAEFCRYFRTKFRHPCMSRNFTIDKAVTLDLRMDGLARTADVTVSIFQ